MYKQNDNLQKCIIMVVTNREKLQKILTKKMHVQMYLTPGLHTKKLHDVY